jgi:hypothetical protein
MSEWMEIPSAARSNSCLLQVVAANGDADADPVLSRVMVRVI